MIINGDDRQIVGDLSVRPHSATCLIQTRYSEHADLVGFGTGFVVGQGRLATAAHVLWNDVGGLYDKRLPDSIEIFLGAGLLAGHPELAFTLAPDPDDDLIHPAYLGGDHDFDVARLVLSQATTAPLSVLGFPADLKPGETVTIGGFPTDLSPFRHREASGPLGQLAKPTFLHQVDTGHGQSGAPVRVPRNGGWTVIGVHLGDAGDLGPGQSPMNRALALTPDIVAWLLKP